MPSVATAGRRGQACGRILRPQMLDFGRGQPEHKVRWEAVAVSLDLFVETFGEHTIKGGQVRVEHDATASNDENSLFKVLGGLDGTGSRGHRMLRRLHGQAPRC